MIITDQPETIHIKLILVYGNLMNLKVWGIVGRKPSVAMSKTVKANPGIFSGLEWLLELLITLKTNMCAMKWHVWKVCSQWQT